MAIPTVSRTEIKTNGYIGINFYDLSLVDGSNLFTNLRPMPGTADKDGARDNCKALTCEKDLSKSVLKSCRRRARRAK